MDKLSSEHEASVMRSQRIGPNRRGYCRYPSIEKRYSGICREKLGPLIGRKVHNTRKVEMSLGIDNKIIAVDRSQEANLIFYTLRRHQTTPFPHNDLSCLEAILHLAGGVVMNRYIRLNPSTVTGMETTSLPDPVIVAVLLGVVVSLKNDLEMVSGSQLTYIDP